MRVFVSAAVLAAALAWSAALPAQEQTTALAVRVVDASDAPVSGARLELVGTRVSGLSGDSGWVRLQGVPVGPALLRVSRIGYMPVETTVQLAAGTPFEADVELARAPVALRGVRGESSPRNPALGTTGFYARKERGFGVFLTEDDIERSGAHRTSDLFRRIAGVRVVYNPSTHAYKLQSVRYGLSLSQTTAGAFSGRGGGGGGGGGGSGEGGGGGGGSVCEMMTVLDGVPVKLDGIDDVRLENLGGVEVYRGPSEIPAEFNQTGSVCGVVVMWTRVPSAPPASASPAPAP
jgi:carboxypeptidase family protein